MDQQTRASINCESIQQFGKFGKFGCMFASKTAKLYKAETKLQKQVESMIGDREKSPEFIIKLLQRQLSRRMDDNRQNQLAERQFQTSIISPIQMIHQEISLEGKEFQENLIEQIDHESKSDTRKQNNIFAFQQRRQEFRKSLKKNQNSKKQKRNKFQENIEEEVEREFNQFINGLMKDEQFSRETEIYILERTKGFIQQNYQIEKEEEGEQEEKEEEKKEKEEEKKEKEEEKKEKEEEKKEKEKEKKEKEEEKKEKEEEKKEKEEEKKEKEEEKKEKEEEEQNDRQLQLWKKNFVQNYGSQIHNLPASKKKVRRTFRHYSSCEKN